MGAKNKFQTTISYHYDYFLLQVNNLEQLVSWWEWSKYYYVNCERYQSGDKLYPHNINVSFTNNSNVVMDVLIFVQYTEEITLDVVTGLVIK